MIEPGIGRIVHFYPGKFFQGRRLDHTQPYAAIVVLVHHERLINLTAFDHTGFPCSAMNVRLLQDDDEPPAEDDYAAWMPYQKGQAAKTEALEQKLAGNKPNIGATNHEQPASQ